MDLKGGKTVSFLPSFQYIGFDYKGFCGDTFKFVGIDHEARQHCDVQVVIINQHFQKNGPWFISHCESFLGIKHPNIVQVLQVQNRNLSEDEIKEFRDIVKPPHPNDERRRNEEHVETMEFEGCYIIKTVSMGLSLLMWIGRMSEPPFETEDVLFLQRQQMQVALCQGVLNGLSVLHKKNIFHGNLSVDTVKFSRSEGDPYCLPIKILLYEPPHTLSDLAPEQRLQSSIISKETDIYNLGILIWQVLQLLDCPIKEFGEKSEPVYHEVEEHPVIINGKSLIVKMREKDPSDRVQNVSDVQLQFATFTEDFVMSHSESTSKVVALLHDNEHGDAWFLNLSFVKKLLGSGSFGSVVEAFDNQLKRRSAVKIILQENSPSSCTNISYMSDAAGEFENTENCYHRNLVRLYQFKQRVLEVKHIVKLFQNCDQTLKALFAHFLIKAKNSVDVNAEIICIEMELCGPTLREWIDDVDKSLVNIDMVQLRVAEGLINGMTYLHGNGVVHRDLKPDNIFFTVVRFDIPTQYLFPIKIGDFGLSKVVQTPLYMRQKLSAENVGTFHYMAPEVGDNADWKKADIYSLGLVIWEACQLISKGDRNKYFHELVENKRTDFIKRHPLISNFEEVVTSMTLKDVKLRLRSLIFIKIISGNKGQILFPKDSDEFHTILGTCCAESVIQLGEGVYRGPFVSYHQQPRITVRGLGTKSTVIQASGGLPAVLTISNNFCTIRDLKIIDPTGISRLLDIHGEGCIVDNVSFYGGNNALRVMRIKSSNETVMSNVKIKKCKEGILVAVNLCTLKNIRIHNAASGIVMHPYGNHCTMQSIQCTNCNIGIEHYGKCLNLTSMSITNVANVERHSLVGIKIYNLSNDNTITNVNYKGMSKESKEKTVGISLGCRTKNNEISNANCAIDIDGEGHSFIDCNFGTVLQVRGNGHSFFGCNAASVHKCGYHGEIAGEDCDFGEIVNATENGNRLDDNDDELYDRFI